MPDGWTLAGGPLLLAGCALTIHAQGQRERLGSTDASAGAGAGDGEMPSRRCAREGAMRLAGDDDDDNDDSDERKAGDGRTSGAVRGTDAESQAVLELVPSRST
jgi:hypothetical protein